MKYIKVLIASLLCLLLGSNMLFAQTDTDGVLSGEFSVSSTKKVRFSQGNLQYQASTNTWRFAANQYDFIKSGNNKASATYSGWIDIFGYATSGWRAPGQTYCNYQPWQHTQSGHNATAASKAYLHEDMTGANDSADWGVYNAIINGGNRKGLWRVLTKDEWYYLMYTRREATSLRFKVRIDGDTDDKLGLLLFPDGATTPSFLNPDKSPTANSNSARNNHGNDITMAQFNQCVALGAVYLPAAGLSVDYGHSSDDYKWEAYRNCDGCDHICEPDGMYWTSTHKHNPGSSNSTWSAYRVGFWEGSSWWCENDRDEYDPNFDYNCSYHKYSVRLVREVYTVKFYNYDGTLLKTEYVLHGNTATPPADPTKPYNCYDQNFIGWDSDVTKPITSNKNFHAQFQQGNLHSFTVVFLNYDGTIVDTKRGVKCGDPISTTHIPTRPAAGSVRYTFKHWYKDGGNPNQPYTQFNYPDTVVRAQYQSSANYFEITFKDDRGNVLAVDSFEWNTMPVFYGQHQKVSNCTYTYTFNHWNPAVVPATSDAVYTAVYDTVVNKYQVRWLNWNNRELKVDSVGCNVTPAYTGVPPTRDADSRFIYTFTGWNPQVGPVNCDTQFVAQYDKVTRYYHVRIVSHLGAMEDLGYDTNVVYRDTIIEYQGHVQVLSSDVEDYDNCPYHNVFREWMVLSEDLDTLTGISITDPIDQDLIFVAQYTRTLREYEMKWMSRDGIITNNQYYDSLLIIPTVTDSVWTNDSIYIFNGWTPDPKKLSQRSNKATVPCGNTTYTAKYRGIPRFYDVIVFYQDSTDNVLVSDTVNLEFGREVNFDTLAKDRTYCDQILRFTGWDPELEPVTDISNKRFVAQYQRETRYFDVNWLGWAGDTISSVSYRYQQKITECVAPARPATNDTVYFFTGWTPAPAKNMPCENQTYTATYRAHSRYIIDTIITKNDTILDTVVYDSLPHTDLYDYDIIRCDSSFYFVSWTPTPSDQDTVGVTYTANYREVINNYSITWLDWDGRTIQSVSAHDNDNVVVPSDPKRAKDTDHVYFFKEWTPAVKSVVECKDQEYTATYITKDRFYTDTIILFDNDTQYVTVEYKTTPNLSLYEGMSFSKCDSVFSFREWTPTVHLQDTMGVTYTAVYDTAVSLHSVTWRDWNNQVLHFEYIPSGNPITRYPDPASYKDGQNVYFFLAWNQEPAATMPCTDVEYKATYFSKPLYYTDSLIRLNDTIVTEPIEFGTIPNFSQYENTVTDCDTIYTFAEWIPAIKVQDTMTIKYVARYNKQVRKHNVKWLDHDNTVLGSKDYEYLKPVTKLPDPTRSADVNSVYFFIDWTPTFNPTMACNDVVYKAMYRVKPRYYRDTLIRGDNDTIITEPIEFGTTPDFTKYENILYHCDTVYTFREWSPALQVQDTMPVKYVALYDKAPRYHNVTWLDHDNTVLDTKSYQYEKQVTKLADPTRQPDVNSVYFFTDWTPTFDPTMACNDVVYTANYRTKPRFYYDTLVLKDDSVYPVVVEFGTKPNLTQYEVTPVEHCDYIYTFKQWVPTVQVQDTMNITYKAIYDSVPKTYSISWINHDGTTLKTEVRHSGDDVVIPAIVPTKPTSGASVYFFSGWDPDPTVISTVTCDDLVFTAQFTDKARFYIDTLVRYRKSPFGDTLYRDTLYIPVEYGTTPDLTKYNNTIVRCDSTLTVASWTPAAQQQGSVALTYVANYSYEVNTYSVDFYNYSGLNISHATYKNGETVTEAQHPSRPKDPNNVYFFDKWSPDFVSTVNCADASYTALFYAKPRYYVDTLIRYGKDTVFSDPIEFGETPDFSKYEDDIVNCDTIYTFIGWTPDAALQTQDTMPVKYVARYSKTVRMHNVTWKNWNSAVIACDDYEYLHTVTKPADPTRQKDQSNVYFFTDWNPTFNPVMECNDVVYRAQFRAKSRFYRDTLVRLYGDTLSDPVDFGTNPNLSNFEVSYSDCDTLYTFNGWLPDPSTVIQDTLPVKFVAQYIKTPVTHNVTWKNWNGRVLDSEDYEHNARVTKIADPSRPKDPGYVYFFTDWDPVFNPVMGCDDVVYQAQFRTKSRYYRDTLILFNGDTLSDPVEYGETPNFVNFEDSYTTCDTLYTFTHWTPNPLVTPQDTFPIVYTAHYSKSPVYRDVTFRDWSGSVIDQGSYKHGENINIPADPTRRPSPNKVYFFVDWTPQVDPVMGCDEVEYTATYREMPRYYQDTLIIFGDTVIPQTLSEYGQMPDFSDYENDSVDCMNTYRFLNWTPAPQIHDTLGVTYTAVFDTVPNVYTVTWRNWNGNSLGVDQYHFGDTIVRPTDEPVRGKDVSHVYFFDHWNPTPDTTMPCGNVVYTAIYTSAPRYYRDTVVRFGNDTVVPQIMLEYGQMPTSLLSDFEDEVYSDCYNTYTFREWIPTPAPQGTSAITYVADYDTVPNKYAVTWLDYDNSEIRVDSLVYEAPIVAPADPTRPQDVMYTYTFSGWSPQPDATVPCHDVVYQATYSRIAREYIDTVFLHNDQDTLFITVHYGERPDLTQYQDSLSSCAQTYQFHHWEPLPGLQDTLPVGYHAKYSTSFNKYVITWNTWDGNYYSSDTLQYNAKIYTPVVNPERGYSEDSVYFFDHWSPAPAKLMPCGNVTYTATYYSRPRFFDIPVHTMEYDTTIFNIQYGENPSRELAYHEHNIIHCDSTYIFKRWTPTPSPKDTNYVEYYAVYDSYQNSYNVTWMNGRDTVTVRTANYGAIIHSYGIPTPTRPATQDSIYIFKGWKNLTSTSRMGCGDTTFYAMYNSKSAWIGDTIVLKDTIIIDTIPFDSTPNLHRYENDVVHCDYTYIFNHWTPDPDTMHQPGEPVTFVAVYDSVLNDYYVTWVNNGTMIRRDTLHCGDVPSIADPTRPSTCDKDYTFTGWTPQIAPVTRNVTYTAQYSSADRYHTITWYDDDSVTVLRVDTLLCGANPSYPCVTRDGGDTVNYHFTGWTPALSPVAGSASYYATYESQKRVVTYNSDLNYVLCTGDALTLPSGKSVQVTADATVLDTVYASARRPYAGTDCYNNDSLVDCTVYSVAVANYKNPFEGGDLTISCPDKIVEGMFINVAQTLVDIKAAFVGAYDEMIPDWTTAEWRILDLTGKWVPYTGTEIRDREIGDTIYLIYVIPTNCDDIIVDINSYGCDMTVHKANADNCPDCQNDSVVIAVYDWLLMYEHVRMQAQGYNVTPDKVYWFAIGGDDWDNLEEWTIPMALDDEYLGNGYYYTINQAFNGTGDYYALVDVTGAGDKAKLPCLGIMRSRRFHYAVASANAPVAKIYPTEVRNSDVVYVVGLQSDVENDIYVYDMAGKLVSHDTVTDDHYEFRAAGAAGTYRVVVITENNKQTLSFIIL